MQLPPIPSYDGRPHVKGVGANGTPTKKIVTLTHSQLAKFWDLLRAKHKEFADKRVPGGAVALELAPQVGAAVTADHVRKALKTLGLPRWPGFFPKRAGRCGSPGKLKVGGPLAVTIQAVAGLYQELGMAAPDDLKKLVAFLDSRKPANQTNDHPA